jgi:ABC-type multidrug transport system ATPase subunit
MSFDNVTATGLTKLFGRHRALSSVSLELRAGELCALLGPNGAGKSTLVGILSTLVRPTSGDVKYGANGELAPRDVRAAIGVLAHESLVYGELTAVENLTFWGTLYDVRSLDRRAEMLLDEVGLDAAARVRPARTYSRGMLQRLALARALLHEPRLLLLDEPFTGLDREGSAALARTLASAKKDGRIVLVVTHDLEAIAGLCDHVVVLRRGKVSLDERRAEPYSYTELKERLV